MLKPVRAYDLGADLGVVRIRFIPARGHVYGPKQATAAAGPGNQRIHQIVRPENRILNERASWCSAYDGSYSKYDNPEPSDTYDGADVDESGNRSWGVVDDTCDAVITASLVVNGFRQMAAARVFVGPPDYAPDRRPFASLADDLTERTSPEPEPVTEETPREIADLFRRVFETISLLNVDYVRDRAIRDNGRASGLPPSKPPNTDARTMTAEDVGFAEKTPTLVKNVSRDDFLPYSEAARSIHEPLADPDLLQAFLRENGNRVRKLLRPPFGSVRELGRGAGKARQGLRRDPRIPRDRAHDMRMPPYMRDEIAAALSLNRRQYLQILNYLKEAEKGKPAGRSRRMENLSPAEQHVRRVVARRLHFTVKGK